MTMKSIFDLVAVTYDILPLYLNAKIQVCMSVRSAGRDVGCKNSIPNEFII